MNSPTYVIAAAPPLGSRLRGFYQSHNESVKMAIAYPHRFRWAGFDVSTGAQPVLKDDEYYELEQTDRKLLRLYKDGTMLFRAAADHEFLGWGQEPEAFQRTPRLNPVAVVEVHASFVTLYQKVLEGIIPVPDQITFHLILDNARVAEKPLALTQYYDGGIQNVHMPTMYRAHSAKADAHLVVSAEELQQRPLRTAYRLVELFADFFDMDHSLIPFAEGEGEHREIRVDKLTRL